MKILVVIPAYNEAQNIVSVAEEVKRVTPQYDFVVVNDGSRDETAKLCREHGYPLLDLIANLGLTGAVQTGMRYALENGYDAVVQIDGDGQHDPRFIPGMEALMAEKELDLVIGSRLLEEKRGKTMRHLGNGLLNRSAHHIIGTDIVKPTAIIFAGIYVELNGQILTLLDIELLDAVFAEKVEDAPLGILARNL